MLSLLWIGPGGAAAIVYTSIGPEIRAVETQIPDMDSIEEMVPGLKAVEFQSPKIESVEELG